MSPGRPDGSCRPASQLTAAQKLCSKLRVFMGNSSLPDLLRDCFPLADGSEMIRYGRVLRLCCPLRCLLYILGFGRLLSSPVILTLTWWRRDCRRPNEAKHGDEERLSLLYILSLATSVIQTKQRFDSIQTLC